MTQRQDERNRTEGRIPGQRQPPPPVPPGPSGPTSPAAAPSVGSRWDLLPWRTLLRVSLSRALLAVVVSLLVWSVLPMALGWAPRVILSGSMEPRIHTGDVIVTRTVDPSRLSEGNVVTTVDPDQADKTRTHRFVELAADGQVVTKGDANRDNDSSTVAGADVLGVGVIRVPYIGLPAYWVTSGQTLALGVSFAALSGLVLAAWTPRRRGGPGGESRDGGAAPGRRRRAGTAVTVATGTLLALTLTGQASYAAVAAQVPTGTSSFPAAARFLAPSYSSEVLGDSPSFYWRMDDTSGSRATDAANGRNGTASNPRWNATGALLSQPTSAALDLDGGYVDQGTKLDTLGAYSLELWMRTTRTSGGAMLSLLDGGTVERSLYLGQDGRVRFARTGTAQVSSSPLNDGAWHHVVYTNTASGASGQRGKLYVDGSLVSSGQGQATTVRGGTWRAGLAQWSSTWPGSPDQYYRGGLDEVAVYGDTLTAAEVTAHYEASGR